MKLTRYERETIILFHEKEKYVSVFTHNTELIERLGNFSKKHPQMLRIEAMMLPMRKRWKILQKLPWKK